MQFHQLENDWYLDQVDTIGERIIIGNLPLMVLIIAVVAAIAIAILYVMIRKIIYPLKDLQNTAEQIAAGELIEDMIQDSRKP
ncbi:hypothetical protein [Brevibacillus sp. SYSU BS000544]|uniref:hypothetical protein n=1 Tax=Brevibacillus sp. SYSU BS000544 TaxID=3416443 RepID=UPI003CE57BFB